jgi:quinol monooxygenase YgiN/catechol 2,3-dioxygenase-like lactoylglutathione lyase family enzyme
MRQKLTHIAIVVDDYDKAINFYTQKLHFTLTADTVLTDTKRWVLVTPKGAKECSLLLAKGVNEEQKSRIGNQTGGRVFLFLHTYNFKQDYQNLLDNQIKIVREPSIETYGTVAVFEDIYGNLWDLIEPNNTKENLYYSTAIFTIKDASKIALTISELSKLRQSTLLENGNIEFDIQQSIDDQTKIIITECFENEQAFKEHLGSAHLQDFLNLDLVKLENGFTTTKIL